MACKVAGQFATPAPPIATKGVETSGPPARRRKDKGPRAAICHEPQTIPTQTTFSRLKAPCPLERFGSMRRPGIPTETTFSRSLSIRSGRVWRRLLSDGSRFLRIPETSQVITRKASCRTAPVAEPPRKVPLASRSGARGAFSPCRSSTSLPWPLELCQRLWRRCSAKTLA